jgi:tetratricopeptide (TPR) repeat protein
MRSAAVITGVLLLAGCAARGPDPQLIADRGRADILFADGCYRCLEQALIIYQRLADAPRAPIDAVQRAFETAVLLSVRAKELGIEGDAWIARARELAARVPASPGSLPAAAYVDAAELVNGDTSGLDPEVRQLRTRRPPRGADPATPPPARAALEPFIATNLVVQYLALAFDCEDAYARRNVREQTVLTRFPSSPAIHFRLSTCGMAPQLLETLRTRDPRWADTLVIEGRRHLSARPVGDVQKAVASFSTAHDAFPESDAITMALAHAQNMLGEYDAALANFDAILGKHPTHRDAMLGRVVSLSYLTRHGEAIPSATRLIDLGTWHIGDAYYWRAWNRYNLRALDTAWDDIEQATRLLVNSSVYTLAGFIAYARKELETAINRFDRAYAMDATNCEAVWTAGLVHVELVEWRPAAPKFANAMRCFTAAAAAARREIAGLEASTLDAAVRARRIAIQQKLVDTSEHRAAQAAFNAAQSHAQLGEKAVALDFASVAAEHVLLREKALTLKTIIGKLP